MTASFESCRKNAGDRHRFRRSAKGVPTAIVPIIAGIQNPALSRAEIMIGMLLAAMSTELAAA
jgi:hypothetical protein